MSSTLVENKKHYRPDEVCEMLNIGKSTFYRLIHRIDNPLPAVKMPTIRVPVKKFDSWLESIEIDELK